jgi:hypothetical protein
VLRELREIDQEHLTEAMGLVPLHWQAQHVDADEVLVRRHAPQVEGFLANIFINWDCRDSWDPVLKTFTHTAAHTKPPNYDLLS